MTALGPLLFVLLLTALATAGFTGVGVQDTRDTLYTLVCTYPAQTDERRPRLPQRLQGEPVGQRSRFALPAFASRRLSR